MNKDEKAKGLTLFSLVLLIILISTVIFTGEANAISIDPTKFYTLAPAGQSTELWTVDPTTGATESVLTLQHTDGSTPNFRTNTIAFSPDNQLYGWENTAYNAATNDGPGLYNIDLDDGTINYLGEKHVESPRWINGMAFNRTGDLYGLTGGGDTLYKIDTSTGIASNLDRSYVDVKHNGLAVDFDTSELYSISGWQDGKPDYLLKIDPDPSPVVDEVHSTDTSGNYAWTTSASGTGYSYNSSEEHIYMDGTYSGGNCCWVPASVQSERAIDLPSSGYAKFDLDIVGDGAGQSRFIVLLEDDNGNQYSFKVTDDTYGSSGYTQGVTKKINGVVVDQYNSAGTIALGGNETGNTVNNINEHVVVEIEWSPTYIKLIVNGITIKKLQTTDTTIIDPTKIIVKSYRLNTKWNSVEIQPGVAQIIAELGDGIDYYGVGTEFDPMTGDLYTIRNSDILMNINLFTGAATQVAILDDLDGDPLTTFNTVSLAAPYSSTQPVPEPGTFLLLGIGLVGLRSFIKKKAA